MPLPKPHKGESQSDFMSRCVPEAIGSGDDKRPQDQAVAMCLNAWRDAHPGAAPAPKEIAEWRDKLKKILARAEFDAPEADDDEAYDDFMDRCMDRAPDDMDDDEAQQMCQTSWEDSHGDGDIGDKRFKTHAEPVHGMEFVLSDETPDRIGDVITAAGWDLENFKKNPIALFNHRSDAPIGKWAGLRVDKGALRGKLQLAPQGTSARIDEIRALVDADILRAVSVGFRSLASEPRKIDGRYVGEIFTKQELLETSLVSVPANPNALAIAKGLGISSATIDLVFAGHGDRGGIRRRGINGGHAEIHRRRKGNLMSSLSQRIAALQTQIAGKTQELEAHLERLNDDNVSDADMQKTADLNVEIAQKKKHLETMLAAEKTLAGQADDGTGQHRQLVVIRPGEKGGERRDGDTAAAPTIVGSRRKEITALDLIVRAGVVRWHSKVFDRSPDDSRVRIYGQDEPTKVVCDWLVRAASAPADTVTPTWATELVQQIWAEFMPLLVPKSVFTKLSGLGLTLSFGRAGKINIPTRSRTPTVAGSFVGEGQPIPVRQAGFATQRMTPKKMAVITTWTREMDEHSIPAIEGLLREAIQEDTSVSIDTVLIDNNPATTIRPQGLLNGVVAAGAGSPAGGVIAVNADVKAMTTKLAVDTYGNIRRPCWLMNVTEVNNAKQAMTSLGTFPYRDEINAGNLSGYPFAESATVPPGTIILVDAADFVSISGNDWRFEISDQATLHMEDTTPLPLAAPGSPATVAAPQRSLWQTNSLGLRLILPLNWLQRRAGTVEFMTGVNWA